MALNFNFPFRSIVDVFVTHVDLVSGNFFIQMNSATGGKFDSLMNEIDEYARREPATLKPSDITVGEIYVARYSQDEMWYRARMLDVQDLCKVHFVDYGNTEFVMVDGVRPAKAHFMALPPQSFECELRGIENARGLGIDQEVIRSLRDRILEKELFCRAESLKRNGVLVVNLYTDKAGARSVTDDVLGTGISGMRSRQLGLKYQQIRLQSQSFHDLCVVHVRDPGHFWCQLISNTELLQDLMLKLGEEYSDEDALPGLRCYRVGTPCCAKFVLDSSWYRAVITNVGCLPYGKVEVRFVDFGNSQKTRLSDIKELKADLHTLPMQGIKCALDTVESTAADKRWSVDAMSLFNQLIADKHVVGLVTGQENVDGCLKLKIFDTTSEVDLEVDQVLIAAGYAVNTDKEGRRSSPSPEQGLSVRSKVPLAPAQVFVCQNLTPGLEKKVLVSSAESPSKFYCQLYSNANKLRKLSTSINRIYSKLRASEELLTAPSPGYPCCAQFTVDGCWYRALIRQVSRDGALVLYVDFGNSETLPFGKLKRLLPKFLELPRQAVVCSLNRVRANGKTWSQVALNRFNALTEGAAKMKIVAQGDRGIHHVELFIGQRQQEKNVSDELLLAGSAVLTEGSTITNYPSLTLDIGQYEDVEVTCIEDPYSFWCTLSKFTNQRGSTMIQLQRRLSECPHISPSVGMPCCAQLSVDDVWYRAQFRTLKGGKRAEVYFVDLGYKEVLPLCRIRPIAEDLLKQSAQAIHCSLKDIVAPSVWPANALRHFEDMTIGKELVLKPEGYDMTSGKYSVLLLDTSYGQMASIGGNMTQMLNFNGSCVDILDLAVAPGTSESVFVTYVTGFQKFFCQVTRSHPELDNLMWQMENHYTTLDTDQEQLREPVVGTFCAAKFAPDDSWYRGKILDVHGKSVTLQYVDFGTSGSLSASKIKVLRPEFGALPCQVFECSLERSWGVSDLQFKELVLDREFEAQIVAAKKGEPVEVKLFTLDTGEPIIESQHKNVAMVPIQVPKVKLNMGETKMLYITVVEGVARFYGQLVETLQPLNRLMGELENHYNCIDLKDSIPSSVRENQFYVTKGKEDNAWYRALVTGVSGSQAEVLYIDYGNRGAHQLHELRMLQREFAALPAQATQLSLGICGSLKSQQLETRFKELALGRQLVGKTLKQVSPDTVEIDLFVTSSDEKDLNIAEMLVNEGLAVSAALPAHPDIQGSSAPKLNRLAGNSRAHKEDVRCIREQVSAKGTGMRIPDPHFPTTTIQEICLTAGHTKSVYLSFAPSPESFWVQLESRWPDLDALSAELEAVYTAEQAEQPSAGQAKLAGPCCAMSLDDQAWYRAELIRSLPDSTVEVHFVDFGNSQILPSHLVRDLKPKFFRHAKFAISCKLAGPSPERTAFFETLDVEKPLQATFTAHEGNQWLVSLKEESSDARVDPTQKRYVKAALPVGRTVKLVFVRAESPSCVFLHRTDGAERLGELMDSIASDLPERAPTDLRLGAPCLARLSHDNFWYRAEVIGLEGDKASVRYVDYGGKDEWLPRDRLRQIKDEHLALPAYTVQCEIQMDQPGVDMTKVTDTLNARLTDKSVDVEVLSGSTTDPCKVRLVGLGSTMTIADLVQDISSAREAEVIEGSAEAPRNASQEAAPDGEQEIEDCFWWLRS